MLKLTNYDLRKIFNIIDVPLFKCGFNFDINDYLTTYIVSL